MKKGIKDVVAPQGMFEDLGLKYVGPVDGNDVEAVEHALRRAATFGGPVIVHCLTRKGLGYAPAENDEADRFHGIGVIDPTTGRPLAQSSPTWTSVFGEELVAIGRRALGHRRRHRRDAGPARARRVRPRVPDARLRRRHRRAARCDQSAAGLAMGGLHPVVAVYATFLNRAFDQVLMDVALHRLGVTFVLDRAGVTGDDGASHNGMWDLSVLQVVPGLRIAAPRDASRLRSALAEAVSVEDAPTVVRYPKGSVPDDLPAVEVVNGVDVLRRVGERDVLVVAVGAMAGLALDLADRLDDQGIGVTVVDPRWVKPLPPGLVPLGTAHRLVVVVEDNVRAGGVGDAVARRLADAGVHTPVRGFGVPERFLAHGTRAEVLTAAGLTAADVAREVIAAVSAAVQPSEEPAATRRQ